MIAITAKPARGFWRGGAFHPPTRTVYADRHFTREQLMAMSKESMLVLESDVDNDVDLDAELKARVAGKEKAPGGNQSELSPDELPGHKHNLDINNPDLSAGEKQKRSWFGRGADDNTAASGSLKPASGDADASKGAGGTPGDGSKPGADQN